MAISFSSCLIVVVHLLLCLTVAGQETVVLHNNYKTHHYYSSSSSSSIAATVAGSDLFNLSSSVILAETWLRNHVLSHYPSTNITSIVVGEDLDLSCNITTLPPQILPSVKNLHYSLVRWGLVRDIKASIAFSHDCFKTHYHHHHHHQQQHTYLSPVLSFLQDSNSIYTINPPLHFDHSPASIFRLISTHKRGLDRLGFYRLKIVILGDPLNVVHRTRVRKLISYPEKPKSSDFQNHAPSSPESIFSFIPSASPSEIPQDFVSPSPSSSSSLSPCPAFDHHYHHHRDMTTLSPTKARDDDGLWCVAKPAVPTETLQKGIDFACGKGGADCEEISPKGSCYYPDNVVAHASYAYNSYWQKTRSNGGSCGFDGTAILIDADPSFLHCRFQIGN
ncbi:Beta-1,3-endoglucanase, family GH17 [Zostera marina]|uniref:Beta-1,3-endoglucanase, family GH17 n=1 Tax=Zostera marina TaxID=29655 RepID=A0A0K9NKS5_ZOSMR|nr:Beta-1,3-endoglucanase, family GH17 [Zostera marina]